VHAIGHDRTVAHDVVADFALWRFNGMINLTRRRLQHLPHFRQYRPAGNTLEKDVERSAKDLNRASLNTRPCSRKTDLDRADEGVGILTAEDAIAFGVTGPVLRASGVKWDIRKAAPYAAYDQYKFEIPVGTTGDTYDRYLVRMKRCGNRGDLPASHREYSQRADTGESGEGAEAAAG